MIKIRETYQVTLKVESGYLIFLSANKISRIMSNRIGQYS